MTRVLPALFLLISVSGWTTSSAQIAQRPDIYDWIEFADVLGDDVNSDQKILIDIFSPNCSWCARMYREVYSDSTVHAFISSNFRLTQLDLEDFVTEVSYKEHQLSVAELAYGLGASGTPTTVFQREFWA